MNDQKEFMELELKNGYDFKFIIDFIRSKCKLCNFIFDIKGIMIKGNDINNSRLFVIKLYAKKMKYKCNSQIIAGFHIPNFYKSLKTIKKKDGIKFSIVRKDNIRKLLISPFSQIRNSISSSNYLQICAPNCEEKDPPINYNEKDDIKIFPKDFTSLIKDLIVCKKDINIKKTENGTLRFYSENGELHSSELFIEGTRETFNQTKVIYDQDYENIDFSSLAKISTISSLITLNLNVDLPFRIIFELSIGKIILYVKSKNMIANEQETVEEEQMFMET